MSGFNRFQVSYGLGQHTKPIWKTQTISGGVGYKNMGKVRVYPIDSYCETCCKSNECFNKCLSWGENGIQCCKYCGGREYGRGNTYTCSLPGCGVGPGGGGIYRP